MDLWESLEHYRSREHELHWRGTFRDYFNLVRENPRLARLSHARIYDMIAEAGVVTTPEGSHRYRFFEDDLFGLDRSLEQLVEYFHSAAQRLEVRKRILLLMGPVGGGKSTLVTLLKRGLEAYTRTDAGATFGISGCPMHEEPLHLIPDALRPDVERDYGIYIEGDLCPVCRQRLDDEYHGRIEDVPVERVLFSEKHRVGIGTFSPSDPKSQDISELTGSIDLATIGEYGSESDPRAYRFDGELNVANRGLMEFIEMLKSDEKFLYGLLTLSQEQNIKTGRFSMIYADEVIVSHTNETEYLNFVNNKKNEALRDRMILVRVPYNLRVSDETRIYQKLIQESGLKNVHLAPHTLRVASMFAVLSRLKDSKKQGMSLIKKMRLYDGEPVEGYTSKDVRELRDEFPMEGMDGISPRYVINRLSTALVKPGVTCINPLDALKTLKDGLEQHTGIGDEERERLLNLIYEARKEFDEMAKVEVQKAFVYSFEESAQALLNNYLDNIEAYVNKTKLVDPITEEEVEPDEKLMRSIEEQIGITENAKRAFREEILIRISTLARHGQRFSYQSHPGLKQAIEVKLFNDLKNVVKITTSTRTPDQEQLRKLNEVAARLIDHDGYCSECSHAILQYVGTLLSR
ncbi:serine protein kinase [Sulfobacillus acidophilus TPY]|uniref:Serine protein kinase, PrkA n=1 Tax=Sulfobacillus acidophilus (strain ATCC 700253 / DSM 10332 / NAL) TaxID=679936 RepID=G8U0R2_SULAD|nr:serine protein kinase [Sulfobacillus acidophilus TPY]AEW05365.1 putative serine protein kinase, PrkA [Sulfobacillus acidophilus DSM 10332]MCY0865935.1 PrkA family serine protein kinase [Sulfobacillus sp.]